MNVFIDTEEVFSHPLDIRASPEIRDPELVDLQPYQDSVRAERIQNEAEATAAKHGRMREMYGEQMQAAPTQEDHNPDKIKAVSSAELAFTLWYQR